METSDCLRTCAYIKKTFDAVLNEDLSREGFEEEFDGTVVTFAFEDGLFSLAAWAVQPPKEEDA